MAVAIAVIVLGGWPQRPAEAGFRLRIGGPVGVARMAVGRVLGLGGMRRVRMATPRGRIRTAALSPDNLRSAMEAARPTMRAELTAAAALAGWRGGRSEQGWWRHLDGAYGWVGPLFWPFAPDDLADYVLFGDPRSIAGYGYSDIQAALFVPYAQAELAAYVSSGRRSRRVPEVTELCGSASEKAALPIERIAQAVQPNEVQRVALDDLASAWTAGADAIAAVCPSAQGATGLDRLGAMQARLSAMVTALASVQPALAKFHGLLDDDQKARLKALTGDQRRVAAEHPRRKRHGPTLEHSAQPTADAACPSAPQAEPSLDEQAAQFRKVQWPIDEIAAGLHLDDTQRAALEVLQDTALKTLALQAEACRLQAAPTMPARLDAAKAHLQAMLGLTKAVNDALDDFYFNLSDEQKAGFEAMGPRRGV
jgi:hypothetical protein